MILLFKIVRCTVCGGWWWLFMLDSYVMVLKHFKHFIELLSFPPLLWMFQSLQHEIMVLFRFINQFVKNRKIWDCISLDTYMQRGSDEIYIKIRSVVFCTLLIYQNIFLSTPHFFFSMLLIYLFFLFVTLF